jgi:hypothetical protein
VISDYPEILFILPFLYAETHYRFKYFLSYLYKREPEIIADLPSRLEPDTELPVLIIVKDAHLFPATIHEVQIRDKNTTENIVSFGIDQRVSEPLWEKTHFVDPKLFSPGYHELDIHILYSIGRHQKTCVNDNHRGSSHAPLSVYISAQKLPRIGNCFYGDTHVHTNFTSDQVEFAPSINTSATLARSMGLNFFCATDHSYDLDDLPDNYLLNDLNLSKWHSFLEEVNNFNEQESDFFVIPGEEVSVRNSSGKNVHCLVYNSKHFLPGSGDSAERWPHTRSELSLVEMIDHLEGDSLAFAAHPGEKPAFLQRLLINRGQWALADCTTPGLVGLQFINSADNDSDHLGKLLWIQTLLKGTRSSGVCGTDAHGNFARYRQIQFPFFTIKEHDHHLFGQWRTGIYFSGKTITIGSALHALKNGHCFMTNGPALRMFVKSNTDPNNPEFQITGSCTVHLQAESTPEFRPIRKIIVYIGNTKKQREDIFHSWELTDENYHFEKAIRFEKPKHSGYIRAEIETAVGKIALSNPIWFQIGFFFGILVKLVLISGI